MTNLYVQQVGGLRNRPKHTRPPTVSFHFQQKLLLQVLSKKIPVCVYHTPNPTYRQKYITHTKNREAITVPLQKNKVDLPIQPEAAHQKDDVKHVAFHHAHQAQQHHTSADVSPPSTQTESRPPHLPIASSTTTDPKKPTKLLSRRSTKTTSNLTRTGGHPPPHQQDLQRNSTVIATAAGSAIRIVQRRHYLRDI